MNDGKTIKREKRIVLYTKFGFGAFAIIAAFSNHPEYLAVIFGLGVISGIRFFIFNSTKYQYLHSKYKRGEYPAFPFVQAGIILAIVIAISIFLFCYLKIYKIITA